MIVGEIVAKVRADIGDYKKKMSDVRNEADATTPSFNKLGGAAANMAKAFGFILATQGLITFLSNARRAANDLEVALSKLSVTSARLGIDQKATLAAVNNLTEDGLMTQMEAADAMANLFASGFNLEQTIGLMNVFKDSAAFGRQAALGFGESIVGATEGIKNGNSTLVDNAGITKNLSVILKQAGKSEQDLMNVKDDASVRQALYNGLIREGAIAQGNAGRYAETAAGKQAQLNATLTRLYQVVGQAVNPAVMVLTDALGGALSTAISFVTANMVNLQRAAIVVGSAFAILAQIIGATFALMTGTLSSDVLYSTIGGIQKTFQTAQQQMTAVTSKETGIQVDVMKDGMGQMETAAEKKAAKVKEQLQEETEAYERETEKRTRDFKRSMQDLVQAHLDKKKDLEKDLAEENKDFEKSMAQRAKEFKRTMDQMKEDHNSNISDLQKDIQDQKDDYVQKQAEQAEAHQEKVGEIQEQIDMELENGDRANESTLKKLRERLAKEEQDYARSQEKAKIAQDKKLADLQERIRKEEEEYTKKVEEENQRNQEELARDREVNSTKVAELQARIGEENAILALHRDEVAQFKDAERLDDISRLKRQFAEEEAERAAEHSRKLAEITKQGAAEGSAHGGAYGGGLASNKALLGGIGKELGDSVSKQLSDSLAKGAREAGKRLVDDLISSLKQRITDHPLSFLFSSIPGGAPIAAMGQKLNIPGFDTGGIVPGPIGSPQLIMAHGGETVLPTHKNITINQTNNNYRDYDMNSRLNDINFALRTT